MNFLYKDHRPYSRIKNFSDVFYSTKRYLNKFQSKKVCDQNLHGLGSVYQLYRFVYPQGLVYRLGGFSVLQSQSDQRFHSSLSIAQRNLNAIGSTSKRNQPLPFQTANLQYLANKNLNPLQLSIVLVHELKKRLPERVRDDLYPVGVV